MESNLSALEQLNKLQQELGYVKGEISTVAMLGLVGEAGEVLDEVVIKAGTGSVRLRGTVMETIVNCAELDTFKKQARKGNIAPEFEIVESEINFNSELADCFYYLNILATNRGLTILDLAQMAHDKVRAKQAAGGSSEDRK